MVIGLIPWKRLITSLMNPRERYDFLLEADATGNDYWMHAENMEINQTTGPSYESLGHVAEAICITKCLGTRIIQMIMYRRQHIKT